VRLGCRVGSDEAGLPDSCMFMYQMNTKCTRWSPNIPNVCEIFQMAIKYISIFQSKAFQIGIFGLKRNHLATLRRSRHFQYFFRQFDVRKHGVRYRNMAPQFESARRQIGFIQNINFRLRCLVSPCR
jgi:hypothetical protein